jgi:corrinoid protein of di/trimethylamine methyltransferase
MSVETLESLKRAILEYDAEAAGDWVNKAVEEKMDPTKVMNELTATINQVGDRFGKGELWLPDLVGAADAMQAVMPILEEEIKKAGKKRESLGIVVVGTVFGDIHDIGKSMVSTLLLAAGFEVHDLGVNIKAEEFIEAIEKYQPDILAMSALLTMTAPEQRKVINTLKEKGIRKKVKVMVGGGAITSDFAQSIGADGYDPTAPGAVKLAKRLKGV